MKTSLVALVFLVVGCGGGGGSIDAGTFDGHPDLPPPDASFDAAFDASPDASLTERCAKLQDDYPAALAMIGRECEVTQDCTVVGEQPFGTCDCAPAIGACSGVAVNAANYHGSTAEAMVNEFARDCAVPFEVCGDGQVECICDCGPAKNLACKNQRCVSEDSSCLDPPADAGP
jgi:hypothetical protein